jgi:tRNA (guanine10-N2)-dimethyltransferase
MTLLVELSGEQLDLAAGEAVAVASTLIDEDAEVTCQDGQVLVLKAPGLDASRLAGRLGLAHHVSDHVATGPLSAVETIVGAVDIINATSFRVRVRRTPLAPDGTDAKALESSAGALVQKRTGTKVDLGNPDTEIRAVLTEKAHIGLLGGSVDRSAMESRAVRHRPFSQPVSIHPKLARAMINLASVPMGGSIVDPFCGTGGILIEGGLLGYDMYGRDIDPRMVDGSGMNLESMGLGAHLASVDVKELSQTLEEEVDAIVTDPPYGRSTAVHGQGPGEVIESLYHSASGVLKEGGRLVICLPSTDMLPEKGSLLLIRNVYPIRVHKSLTRHICVLSKGN